MSPKTMARKPTTALKERFEKALREYLESREFDFGMAAVEGKTYTRGFVRQQGEAKR
jgi:hypothetical protein